MEHVVEVIDVEAPLTRFSTDQGAARSFREGREEFSVMLRKTTIGINPMALEAMIDRRIAENKLTPIGEGEQALLYLVQKIAENGPETVAAVLRVLREAVETADRLASPLVISGGPKT